MLRLSTAIATALFMPCALAQDPVQTDGDKYKSILENACVRVLDYSDQPGQKTQEHTHPSYVLYVLSPFERELTLPGGKVLRRQFSTGEVAFFDGQTHTGENVGQTPTHVLIVELKQLPQGDTKCAE